MKSIFPTSLLNEENDEIYTDGAKDLENLIPNLVEVQLSSYEWFIKQGLQNVLDEISPITNTISNRFEISFPHFELESQKHDEMQCLEHEISYCYSLHITAQMKILTTGEIKEQKLSFGEIPRMTKYGTFITNGSERVVVLQLIRSPGVYSESRKDKSTGKTTAYMKLIPYRGVWLEFEISNTGVISMRVDGTRKILLTTFLRACEFSEDEISTLFSDVDNLDTSYIAQTLKRDTYLTVPEAQVELYKRLRPNELPTQANAQQAVNDSLFNHRRFDLGKVGRFKINRQLGQNVSSEMLTLTKTDIINVVKKLIRINNGEYAHDDIDNLGNRRVRAVGELLQNQVRMGLLKTERLLKERAGFQANSQDTSPSALINSKTIASSLKDFFNASQLSQFMDQTNPLAEMTHKRRLSALGPGGLIRERAGFDVRDVHQTHYGRICPIETPEGPNIGLLVSMSIFSRLNEYGFLETPYRPIRKQIKANTKNVVGRLTTADIFDKQGNLLVAKGKRIPSNMSQRIRQLGDQEIQVQSYVDYSPDSLIWMPAYEEEKLPIGQSLLKRNSRNEIKEELVDGRQNLEFTKIRRDEVKLVDVDATQIISPSTSLIPFLEHDDGNRALMGSNMQRQAVPLLQSEPPLIGTGLEKKIAEYSGQMLHVKKGGVVVETTAEKIVIETKCKTKNTPAEYDEYSLRKYQRTNQGTSVNQSPLVDKGQVLEKGAAIADSYATRSGELSLGRNLNVAFMSWEGYNFEDAIVLSQELVKYDALTSVHIEKLEVEARETKLGNEEITRDIPNVREEALADLDENGIIRLGAWVNHGDILVGKITPKVESEPSAEEKLLRAIFGEKARDVKDTSLRVPHGIKGKVIDVRELDKKSSDTLTSGTLKVVRVWIAEMRKIRQGDKMAGRHGNKGVVAKILPREDMPFTETGEPIDILLNPIGVPSRMNLGQLYETHLGLVAKLLNKNFRLSPFSSPNWQEIEDYLAVKWMIEKSGAVDKKEISNEIDEQVLRKWMKINKIDPEIVLNLNRYKPGYAKYKCLKMWLAETEKMDTNNMSHDEIDEKVHKLLLEKRVASPLSGRSTLYDGRTGDPFHSPVTFGVIYMMKLIHLVEDKIHARSTGPYSLITQQPLGGKAQFGGQRFGEMEVWALEAYSAAHILREILTIKSDDVTGRVKAYEQILNGNNELECGIPESFHVLYRELQGLGLSLELEKTNELSTSKQVEQSGLDAFTWSAEDWSDVEDFMTEMETEQFEPEVGTNLQSYEEPRSPNLENVVDGVEYNTDNEDMEDN